jgi:hypothetical protein
MKWDYLVVAVGGDRLKQLIGARLISSSRSHFIVSVERLLSERTSQLSNGLDQGKSKFLAVNNKTEPTR